MTSTVLQPVFDVLYGNLLMHQHQVIQSFLELSDTPDAYTGYAGQLITINTAENALEFGDTIRTLIVNPVTNVLALKVKGASGQTANLQEWQNSSGTVLALVSPSGELNVGGSAYTANRYINLDRTGLTPGVAITGLYSRVGVTDAFNLTGSEFIALFAGSGVGSQSITAQTIRAQHTGTGTVNTLQGVNYSIITAGGGGVSNLQLGFNMQNSVNSGTVVGLRGANFYVNAGGSSPVAITDMIGFRTGMTCTNASATITNYYGLQISNSVKTAGSISNSYGLYIDNSINVGSSLKYTIYSLSTSLSILTGALQVGSGLDTQQIIAKGNIAQTANLQEWQNSSGTVLAYLEKGGLFKSSGRRLSPVTKTGTYTASINDDLIVCDSTSAFTINLPAATGSGQKILVKNINTGTITIDANASETIDGATTHQLLQWDGVDLVDYASGAWIID